MAVSGNTTCWLLGHGLLMGCLAERYRNGTIGEPGHERQASSRDLRARHVGVATLMHFTQVRLLDEPLQIQVGTQQFSWCRNISTS